MALAVASAPRDKGGDAEEKLGFFTVGEELQEIDVVGLIGEWIRAGHLLVTNDLKPLLEFFPDQCLLRSRQCLQ